MKLTFKNKMTMGIKKSLTDGEKLGGIPKALVLTSREAKGIINEISELSAEGSDIPKKYIFTNVGKDSEIGNVTRLHTQWRPNLSESGLCDLIEAWKSGKVKVEFKYTSVPSTNEGIRPATPRDILVPLIIEDPKFENPKMDESNK